MGEKEEDLNTYVIDICNEHTLNVYYNGLRLLITKSVKGEMIRYSLSLEDCKKILDEGYEAPRKRAKDTIEKWLNRSNKTYNLVIVELYNYFYKEEVFIIKHVGRFSKRK